MGLWHVIFLTSILVRPQQDAKHHHEQPIPAKSGCSLHRIRHGEHRLHPALLEWLALRTPLDRYHSLGMNLPASKPRIGVSTHW
ncbi:hypothetical protein O3P69_015316 [Scylla paramamosain]|uniref:Secreted protein n=1 Tax=Scylla paramamosain TaxID=85552 RepID=A0AAW0T505_SCYPA